MSKSDKINDLGNFIGLKAAHEILIKFANESDSIPHLEREVDNYGNLSLELAEGNWNENDVEIIKGIAIKRCKKKLDNYTELGENKYKEIESTIDLIMKDLELL